MLIGLITLSSFSVTVVYAQELIPGKIGTVTGLIIGLSFGLGAVGAVVLGNLIDHFGLLIVMNLVSYLPLIGIITYFLPSDHTIAAWSAERNVHN
jgi:FSR family fosmidomycin resistance protein-like MFS transporter